MSVKELNKPWKLEAMVWWFSGTTDGQTPVVLPCGDQGSWAGLGLDWHDSGSWEEFTKHTKLILSGKNGELEGHTDSTLNHYAAMLL